MWYGAGSYLGIVYCGGTGFYLSPISFLKDPVVWIRAMSVYKGTHTQVRRCFCDIVAPHFDKAMNC